MMQSVHVQAAICIHMEFIFILHSWVLDWRYILYMYVYE